MDPSLTTALIGLRQLTLIKVNQSGSRRTSSLKEKATTMLHRLPLTKALINLGQVVCRVKVNKEYFILEKDGIPGDQHHGCR